MANVNLIKPSASIQNVLPITKDFQNYAFDFDISEAFIEKIDNNLVISFESDGSSIILEGFYTVYSPEFMPSFILEGETINGEDFFAALDPELMPAAGDANNTNESGGNFYSQDMHELAQGVSALGGSMGGSNYDKEGVLVAGESQNSSLSALDLSNLKISVKESGVKAGGNTYEAGTLSSQGKIIVSDNPLNNFSFEIVGTNSAAFGVMAVYPDGTFNYILDDKAANSLAEGEKKTESFIVRVTDEYGNSTDIIVDVDIYGTNDAPQLFVKPQGNHLQEDGSSKVLTGELNVYDPDSDGSDENQTFEIINKNNGKAKTETEGSNLVIEGEYGTLTVNPDGTYEYELGATEEQEEALQALGESEQVQEEFEIKVKDKNNAFDTDSLIFDITGTNDIHTLAKVELSSLIEAGVQDNADNAFNANEAFAGTGEIRGSLSDIVSDTDASDSHTFEIKGDNQGFYGILELKADGSYKYILNQAKTESLEAGEERFESFTIVVKDQNGNPVETTISIKVVGTNDMPTLSLDTQKLELTEEAAFVSGKAQGLDVDLGEGVNLLYSLNKPNSADSSDAQLFIETEYGRFEIDPTTGVYTFTANAKAQKLGENEIKDFSFDIYVRDEHGAFAKQTVTVKLTGTNDIPTVELPEGQIVYTDILETSDSIANDVAKGSIVFESLEDMENGSITINGNIFTISKDAEGNYTINPQGTFDKIEGSHGNLSNFILKFNEADNSYTFEYSYTQTDAYMHGTEGLEKAEQFDVIIHDGKNNNTAEEALNVQINVNITDDGPKAVDDTNLSFTEGSDDIRGNLLENDSFGGDGFSGTAASIESLSSTVLINGKAVIFTKTVNSSGQIELLNWSYGKLTLSNDGSYDFDTYGSTVTKDTTFEFTYTIKDSDGDTSSASLKLEMTNVNNANVGDSTITVNEKGLFDSSDNSEITSGSFDVSASNGVKDIQIIVNGRYVDIPLNSGSYDTGTGIFSNFKYVNGKITYTYTQKDNLDHSSESTDQITLVVRDKDYNKSEPTTLTVNIIDDIPIASTSDAFVSIGDTHIGIVDFDFGADSGQGKTISVEGSNIRYVFNEDGKWEKEIQGTDDVWYTVRDAYGDPLAVRGQEGLNFEDVNVSLTYTGEKDTGENQWTASAKTDTSLPEGSEVAKVVITDSDGDKAEVSLEAGKSATDGVLVGVESLDITVSEDTSYNICVMLDTSGSMYHPYYLQGTIYEDAAAMYTDDDLKGISDTYVDNQIAKMQANGDFDGLSESEIAAKIDDMKMDAYRDMIETLEDNGYRSRLSDACDSLEAYIKEVLIDHVGNSSTDGVEINIGIVSFWASAENYSIKIDKEALESPEALDREITEIITEMKSYFMSNDEWKNQTNVSTPDGELGDEYFHHWTDYSEAFDAATEFFEENSKENNHQNLGIIISDGNPTEIYDQSNVWGYDKDAFNRLLEHLDQFNAVGIGITDPKAEATLKELAELAREAGKEGSSLFVTDEGIKNIFPSGTDNFNIQSDSFAFTNEGNDIIVGGLTLGELETAIGINWPQSFDFDAATKQAIIMEYIRQNPEVLLNENLDSTGKSQNDPDAIVSGAGDDMIYGQEGDDIIISDNDIDMLDNLSDLLHGRNTDEFTAQSLAESDYNSHAELVQNLGDEIRMLPTNSEESFDLGDLANYLGKQELLEDGDDLIFGGTGDDIIIALDGDDVIDAGDGNDIIFAGSGDDLIYAGAGDDIIFAGSGDNEIYLGGGSDAILYGIDDITQSQAIENDMIHDFDLSNDHIDLTAFSGLGYSISTSNQEGNGIITIADNMGSTYKTITLVGVEFDPDQISEDISEFDENPFIKI